MNGIQPISEVATRKPKFTQVRTVSRSGDRSAARDIAAWSASSIVIAASATLIVTTFRLLGRGFDFTDQSFYLMLAQQPAGYELTYGLFGYGLHPLYELVGGSIASMERVGALVLVVLGAALGLVVSNKTGMDWRRPAGAQIVAVSASLPLAYYLLWIPVPGYNWIGLVGAIVLLIAMLLLLEAGNGYGSAAAAAAAAILAIFTRPQTAIGFGALYLAAVLLVDPAPKSLFKNSLTQIVRAAGLTAMAVVGIAAILPLGTLIEQSKEYIAIFGTTHPLHFSFIDQQLVFLKSAWLWLVCGAILAFILFSRRGGKSASNRLTVLVCIVVPIISAVILVRTMSRLDEFRIGSATGTLAFCALSLACLRKEAAPRLIALLGVAALIPWIATLGASAAVRPQLAYYSGISSFIAVVGVFIAVRQNMVAVTLASCAGLYLTFSAIQVGLASPYRLAAPVAMQVVPTRMGWGAELKLDSKTSEFITRLRDDAQQGGFCEGGAVIDLSGNLPGAVFAMGGLMPVFPWISAGYPFSNYFAQEYLKRLGQARLARSWLITAETPNTFSRRELESLGVDFAAYRLVDNLPHPVDGTSVKLYAPLADRIPCEQNGMSASQEPR
jgi:hypothetical protein